MVSGSVVGFPEVTTSCLDSRQIASARFERIRAGTVLWPVLND
jgi:hypothetical protein